MNLVLMSVFLGVGNVPQDEIEQDATLSLDAKGDAVMEVTFQLSANQWQRWKSNIGEHPDLLRRDLYRQFPGYDLHDFDLKRDDINRRATSTLKARGAATYKGSGRFEIEVEPQMKLVTHTEREWHFASSELAEQGVLFKQTVKYVLPAGARDARLVEPPDGFRTLSYTVPVGGGTNPWPVVAAVSALGLAALTILRFIPRSTV